jgi:hypothetical protein
VQILQHQQHRGRSAQQAQHSSQALEQPPPPHLRRQDLLPGLPLPGQFGQHPGQLNPPAAEGGRLVIVGQRPKRLQQRRVWQRPAGQRCGTTHGDQRSRPARLVGEPAGQPALAHPGLTGDQHHPRSAGRGSPQRIMQPRQFLIPSDERSLRRPCAAAVRTVSALPRAARCHSAQMSPTPARSTNWSRP